jgi:hypothetical protein
MDSNSEGGGGGERVGMRENRGGGGGKESGNEGEEGGGGSHLALTYLLISL